jgi:hypothetical protein
MKVYVVTHGEYSDYDISHIFATRELAQAFLDDYHARAERASAVNPSGYGGSYNGYGDYNSDIGEWDVLEEVPPLYERWRCTWTEDSGLSRYGKPTGAEEVRPYCSTISTELPDEDGDPPVLDGSDYYHFMLASPPDVPYSYMGPKERPPREVTGRGRTVEAARKAMYDKLAFLKAVAEGIT